MGTYTICGPVCLLGQPPKITAILKTAAFQLKVSNSTTSAKTVGRSDPDVRHRKKVRRHHAGIRYTSRSRLPALGDPQHNMVKYRRLWSQAVWWLAIFFSAAFACCSY